VWYLGRRVGGLLSAGGFTHHIGILLHLLGEAVSEVPHRASADGGLRGRLRVRPISSASSGSQLRPLRNTSRHLMHTLRTACQVLPIDWLKLCALGVCATGSAGGFRV